MKKAVIYARFSSHNQTEQSIEGQVRICKDYCKRNGLEVIDTYADRAISGRTDKRPEFQRMIADCTKKKFEAVVVYKTDRFARDKYDSAIYKQTLKKHGIELHYAAEAIPAGPEGILIESLMEGLAEYYSAELSQKVQRGMYESALKCHSTGSNKPFGYKTAPDKSICIDPDEATGVKMIFDMYIRGCSTKDICDRLTALGYKTSRGGNFNKSSINRIISNEKYIGLYKYKDIRIEDGIPAIIPKDVFYAAQKEMEKRHTKRAPRAKKAEYLLTGKLFCGHCKSLMTGVSGTNGYGERFHYYYCQKVRAKEGCNKKSVPKDWIENAVVEQTVKTLLNKETIRELADKLSKVMAEDKSDEEGIQYCKKKLAENKKAIENLLQMVMNGLGTKAVSDKLKELESEQVSLEGELEYLNRTRFKLTAEQIEFMLLSQLEAADKKNYNKSIIDTFVSEVYLYDDKLLIFYNIKKETGLLSSDLELIEAENCSPVVTTGGADENRTRVRKQIHPSFSERRLRTKFPA